MQKVKRSTLLVILGIMVLLEGTLLSISSLIGYNYPLSSILMKAGPLFAQIARAFFMVSGITLIVAGAILSRNSRDSHKF